MGDGCLGVWSMWCSMSKKRRCLQGFLILSRRRKTHKIIYAFISETSKGFPSTGKWESDFLWEQLASVITNYWSEFTWLDHNLLAWLLRGRGGSLQGRKELYSLLYSNFQDTLASTRHAGLLTNVAWIDKLLVVWKNQLKYRKSWDTKFLRNINCMDS